MLKQVVYLLQLNVQPSLLDVIYHFDLYRLKNESEIYDIGYEEYLFSGRYCFIEWPEKMEHLLPENYLRIRIEVRDKERIICIF